MPGLVASFASLLFAVALLMSSSGLLGSLISLRAVAEGFELQFAALLMSGFYGGMILGTLRCGQLIDRVGHIRAFATFCAVNAMVVLTLPLVVSPWVWLALRFLIGFNMAGLYMVIESWLNARADSGSRGSLMALYMIISYLAMGGGQLLLDLYPITASEPFMLAALLITAALIPVAITHSVHPSPIETDHLSFRRLFAISPLGLLSTSGAGLLSGAVWGLAPIFGRRLGLENDGIALFMGVLVTSGLLLQWPLGKLSDRIDRRTVIAGVAIATALVSAAMVPVTLYYSFDTLDTAGGGQRIFWLSDPIWLLLLAGLFGGLHATLYPLSVAQTNDQAGPGRAVAVSAGLVLAYGSGAIFGPIGAGMLMEWIGAVGLFVFTGIIAVAISILAMVRMRIGETVAEEDKESFVVMPEVSTSPAPGEIDPRTDDEIPSIAA